MDTLFGLPAHPLLVHIPIVMLPLAAIGVIAMVMRPAWHRRYRWVVLGLGVVGALGAVLAAQAGEELEGRIVTVEGRQAASSWEHHAELGETARNFSLLFLIVLLVFVFVPWWRERTSGPDVEANRTMRIATLALSALAVLGAIGSVVTIVQAGHTGSESVWEDYVKNSGG